MLTTSSWQRQTEDASTPEGGRSVNWSGAVPRQVSTDSAWLLLHCPLIQFVKRKGFLWNQKKTRSGKAKKRSKDTLQSNTGYLAIYPWIHCKVSLDTFWGQFSAVFSWTHWIRKRQCVSWLCQTEDTFTPEGAGVSTEAVQFQGKWQQIQYDFYNTVHWFSLWRGKYTGYRHRKIPL